MAMRNTRLSERARGQLRVLHVIETLDLGGAELLLAAALPRLVEAGFHVRIRALTGPKTLASRFADGGVDVSFYTDELPQSRRALVPSVGHLREELQAEPADLVHSHLFHASLVARTACASMRRRPLLVTTLHNPDARSEKLEGLPSSKIWLRTMADGLSALAANDAIVAVSGAVADDYRRRFTGGYWPRLRYPVHVIHNAIDVQAQIDAVDAVDRNEARARCGVLADEFLIVSFGRLTYQKNYELLVRVVKRLQAEGAPIRAIVYGDGPERSALEEMTGDAVRFAGKVPPESLHAALAASDLYVQPSRYEAFGMALVEAMAAERPVIASDVDGIAEVVEDGVTGRLVPPENDDALTAAIRELVHDRALATKWGRAGRRRASERFDLSYWVRRTTDLYEALIDRADP